MYWNYTLNVLGFKNYMTIGSNRESIILFLGDLASLAAAFWFALVVRAVEIPSFTTLGMYASSLVPLSLLWMFTFFIAGLYEKHALVFEKKLPGTVLNAQIANSIIAVIFFYLFTPYLGIAPKTILVLYLVISTVLIILWRLLGPTLFGIKRQEAAILIGAGDEMRALKDEVNTNRRYNLNFVSSVDLSHIEGIDFKSEIIDRIYSEKITSVIIDLRHEKAGAILPALYNLIFSGVRFHDMHKVYEEVFARIPLSLVQYNWFLENISSSSHMGYDILKRIMDVAVGGIIGILSLPLYPFVALAIKLDDHKKVFIFQDRIGKNNAIMKIVKFRSMARNAEGDNVITRVGRVLRATRIDELPQLWNVVKGDLSLVGPRPELPDLVKVYEKEIPYYKMRHLVTPGLSGWGQIRDYDVPRGTADVDKTRTKLSYDLYYIKNRSFMLDFAIALKTIKTLLSRSGN